MIDGNGALASQIGLKIGHQESGSDALSRNVANNEAEALAAQVEKIIVVAANLAGLNANSRVFEGAEKRNSLGEEPALNLFGDFQLLRSPALGFEFGRDSATLCFDSVSDFIEADERKGIAVGIFETGEDTAPNR